MIQLYTKIGSQIFKRPDPFFQFPGGEWHMKDDGNTFVGDEAAMVIGTDPNDYVKLMLWQNACKEYPRIVIPYLPAARADKGSPRGADVYSNLIPEYKRLVTLDAHSNYMIDHLRAVRGSDVVNVMPAEILKQDIKDLGNYSGIIAPDEGSVVRASEVAAKWSLPVYYGEKKRDFETGELLEFSPPKLPAKSDRKRFLVVDDICDGGGTFIGLAQAIRENFPWIRLDLYVTHGIFSKGSSVIKDHYHRLITTDSLDHQGEHARYIYIRNHLLRRAYQ